MPSEIETMASFGSTWHGRENRLERPATWNEMIKASGLDWSVSKREIGVLSDDGSYSPCEDKVAIVRDTDRRVLGVVGRRYQPIQNDEAGSFLDDLPTVGAMEFHTAGSLRGGKQIFVLGKVVGQEWEPIPGDLTESYLLAVNSHDGLGAFRVFATTVRVVCANTLRVALSQQANTGISVRHSQNARDHMTTAREALGFVTHEIAEYRKVCDHLSRLKVTKEETEYFISGLMLPTPPGAVTASTKTLNARSTLRTLVETGMGTEISGVSGTRYGLLQAVTEYTNHYQTNRRAKGADGTDARMSSVLFGSGDSMNKKALSVLTQTTGSLVFA